jgi:hypothetical protein
MDIKRTLASQDLNPAGGTIYVGVHNLESIYRACVAWKKRRGIHRDSKAFGKYGWEKIKLERPVKTPKPVKAPPVKLTVEELRLLGNGVVPATAELAFKTLMKQIGKWEDAE